MVGRGRPRKSDREKSLDGNPGKRPLGGEPIVKGKPTMARGLNDNGKWLWKSVVQSWMGEIDTAQLRVLCETWQLLRVAYREAKNDPTSKETRSQYIAYQQAFDKLASRFGMTPSDRAKIRMPTNQSTDDEQEYFGVVG